MHKSECLDIPLTCMFAVEMRMGEGQWCSMHTHVCTEIIWYRDCCGWLLQGQEKLRYEEGSIAVYQPWLSHGDECETGGFQLCVGIVGQALETLPAGVWHADEGTTRVLQQFHDIASIHDSWRQQRLNLLVGWLFFELRRQIVEVSSHCAPEPYHVASAKRIIDSRFAEPLSIAGIAKELSINVDYLRQLFVKCTGEPPMQYLIRRRLDAACELLRLNQESIAVVASRVGIPNSYYFSRLFRKHLGIPPGEYRMRHAERIAAIHWHYR
ncbi:MAG: helix-turn-helix transcriptional regulator [Victivallales bacterium]|nr:helix-turn-helix transcriptional regulator [Victivallales bacterium]